MDKIGKKQTSKKPRHISTGIYVNITKNNNLSLELEDKKKKDIAKKNY